MGPCHEPARRRRDANVDDLRAGLPALKTCSEMTPGVYSALDLYVYTPLD